MELLGAWEPQGNADFEEVPSSEFRVKDNTVIMRNEVT